MPRKLKVVFAHHEKVIVDTYQMVLQQSNVDIKAAHSGVSALEHVLSMKPDIAILCIVPDAHADDLNGVYAAVVVRTLLPTCRILLCPGGSGGWVNEPLALAAAHGYEFELIEEPINPRALLELLGEMAGGDIEPVRWVAPAKAKPKEPEPEPEPEPEDPPPLEPRPVRRWAIRRFFKKSRKF
jgi:CheY-like chemotaxis protein